MIYNNKIIHIAAKDGEEEEKRMEKIYQSIVSIHIRK